MVAVANEKNDTTQKHGVNYSAIHISSLMSNSVAERVSWLSIDAMPFVGKLIRKVHTHANMQRLGIDEISVWNVSTAASEKQNHCFCRRCFSIAAATV